MNNIMNTLRNDHLAEIAGLKVVRIDDYKLSFSKDVLTGVSSDITLPKSDVLAFFLEGGAKVIVRPSGTEPKIKTYYTAKAPTYEEATALEAKLSDGFSKLFLD